MVSEKPIITSSTIRNWLSQQLGVKEIEEKLVNLGFDEESIATHVKEYNKLR